MPVATLPQVVIPKNLHILPNVLLEEKQKQTNKKTLGGDKLRTTKLTRKKQTQLKCGTCFLKKRESEREEKL